MSEYMTFGRAYRTTFNKFFQFSGNAPRSEYNWKSIAIHIQVIVFSAILWFFYSQGLDADVTLYAYAAIGAIYLLWQLLWGIPLTIRRIRDAGANPWLFLWVIIAGFLLDFVDPTNLLSGILGLAFFIFLVAAPSGWMQTKKPEVA
jgi:uncharacterized membrane protein YhaH (DUF805 family)